MPTRVWATLFNADGMLSELNPLVTADRGSVQDPIDATGAAVELKFASVNATADGANEVVAAVTSKKIRVLGYVLTSDAAQTVIVKSGTTAIARIEVGAAGGGASYAGGLNAPAFQTAAGEALNLTNETDCNTVGHLCYVEV